MSLHLAPCPRTKNGHGSPGRGELRIEFSAEGRSVTDREAEIRQQNKKMADQARKLITEQVCIEEMRGELAAERRALAAEQQALAKEREEVRAE